MFPLLLDDTANTYVGGIGLLPTKGVDCCGGCDEDEKECEDEDEDEEE